MLIPPMRRKVVYYDHASRADDARAPFSCGEAGCVWIDEAGLIETDTRVTIEPNSFHALHGHGVVEQLAGLATAMGRVGNGEDAVLGPEAVAKALRIFYEADRMTYGARHDLLVRSASAHDPVEYRIVVDNRGYQRTLSRLQFMTSSAARMGHGIRLRA